jgi:hypothetical protein
MDIHLEDESTPKDHKRLVIGLYRGFQPFRHFFLHFLSTGVRLGLVGYFSLYFGQQACHHLFHLHYVAISIYCGLQSDNQINSIPILTPVVT